MASAYGRGA
ncbi:mgtC family protein, partial [Yersinia pestis PY-76]